MLIPPALLPAWQRWMTRRHPSAGSEFVLRQNRIYVLPGGFGFAYGATALLVLVGAINYQLSLAYLFAFFLMLGLGHSGLVQAFRNLLGLKIQVEAPRAVFVGQTAWFPLRLSVSNKLDRYALVLTADRTLAGNPVGVAVGVEEVIGVGVPAQHRAGWRCRASPSRRPIPAVGVGRGVTPIWRRAAWSIRTPKPTRRHGAARPITTSMAKSPARVTTNMPDCGRMWRATRRGISRGSNRHGKSTWPSVLLKHPGP